ncbi:hypothetical protein AQV86_05070 [Nanohaloarchaea archaeon SG9]|nr:hypothetical protein AQV86_05070 [Nanohaloarchaea archaeon SG9]
MNIINVLLDSLKMLKRRPQLFLPKLASALISSAWIILIFSMLEARQLQQLTAVYTITTPFIVLLGVFVPLMTAEMISNHERKNLLRSSFLKTAKNWKKVLGVTFLMFMVIFTVSIPSILGLTGFWLFENALIGLAGISVSVLILVGLSFLIYFLPISVLAEDSVISGVRSSMDTSLENRREVSVLMAFSLGLFLLAFGSQGVTRNLGFTAFVFGRVLSATVTTYTFVVSPKYYLKEKDTE